MEVTVRDIRGLYDFLNDLVFGGELPRPTLRIGQPSRAAVAELGDNILGFYWPGHSTRRPLIHLCVHMHGSPDELVGTLAHEMVHHYQSLNGLDVDHGDVFQSFAQAIADDLGVPV